MAHDDVEAQVAEIHDGLRHKKRDGPDADRYDDNVISVTGSLVELQLVNPHSIIAFDVTDANGKTVRWQAEMGGTQQLVKTFGWTKATIKVGDKVTVTGRRAKDGAPYMNLTDRSTIALTDTGKEIYKIGVKGEGRAGPPPQ